MVLSAHGSQFANAVFADAGSLVIELMPPGYWHNDYPSMYALQSHGFPYTHRVIFAEPGKRDKGLELSHATMRCLRKLVSSHLTRVPPPLSEAAKLRLARASQLETVADWVACQRSAAPAAGARSATHERELEAASV